MSQSKDKNNNDLRPHSSQVMDGSDRAASRVMLYAVCFKEDDFEKPQVCIASTWPCPLDEIPITLLVRRQSTHYTENYRTNTDSHR